LTLETEIAKSEAKEQVLASIMEATPRSYVPNPTSLELRKSEEITPAPGVGLETMQLAIGTNGPLPVVVGCSTLNPEEPEWRQPPTRKNVLLNPTNPGRHCHRADARAASASKRITTAAEQNRGMLTTQQKKSNLPQVKIRIFDGDPMEYGPFVRAFENVLNLKRRVIARGYTISNSLPAATLKTLLNRVTIFHPRRVIEKRDG